MNTSFSILALIVILYLTAVRVLRYRRSNALKQRFPTREHFGSMTLEQAWEIQSSLANLDFPTIFSASVFFALSKTYGIPSISRLLAATGQLSNSDTASKRAADTGVILTEVILHPPHHPRAIEGIARMNFLHDRYRRSSKISNDDMLYTLSLFLLEPIRWTKRFGWREVNDVELCAMGTYWRWMGKAMEISFDPLQSHGMGSCSWSDGLEFLQSLREWSLAYESQHMIPAETNEKVAKHTIDIALYNIPKVAQSAAFDLVSALLEPTLRTAMNFKDPSTLSVWLLHIIVAIYRFIMRHLALPRPYTMRTRWWSAQPNEYGRINFGQYIAHPWYIKPTVLNRWGPKALILRLVGGAVPGDTSGAQYCPEGYRITELGPATFRGKGELEMAATRQRLAENGRVACPFAEW